MELHVYDISSQCKTYVYVVSCRMHVFSSHAQIQQPREYRQVQHNKAEKCFVLCKWKPYRMHSNSCCARFC